MKLTFFAVLLAAAGLLFELAKLGKHFEAIIAQGLR